MTKKPIPKGITSNSPTGSPLSVRTLEHQLKQARKKVQDAGTKKHTLRSVRANTGDGRELDGLIASWTKASQQILSAIQSHSPQDITLEALAIQLHVDPRVLLIDPDDEDAFLDPK